MHRRVDRWQQRHAAAGFLFAVRQKYDEDQGRYLAATVTYYAFLSIFPLLLVLVTLLGYALEGDTDLQHRVLDSALADFPVIGDQLQRNVHSLQGSWPALVIGLAIAIWAGTGVCLAIENAMDHIWGVPFKRRANPIFARVRALLWIALLGGVVDHRHVPRRPQHVGVLVRPRPAAARAGGLAGDQLRRLRDGLPRAHERQPVHPPGRAGRDLRRDRVGDPAGRAAATS